MVTGNFGEIIDRMKADPRHAAPIEAERQKALAEIDKWDDVRELTVRCPTCKAEAGVECSFADRRRRRRNRKGWLVPLEFPRFHASRENRANPVM